MAKAVKKYANLPPNVLLTGLIGLMFVFVFLTMGTFDNVRFLEDPGVEPFMLRGLVIAVGIVFFIMVLGSFMSMHYDLKKMDKTTATAVERKRRGIKNS
ncbi:hypothetical protein ACFL2V_18685 [Pseudomonadota bacterium]